MSEVRVGFIGAGRIGGGIARQLAGAGHEVLLSFARDPAKLDATARALGAGARTGSPIEAAGFGDVVVLSVPWMAIDEALAQAGGLSGHIVIDTTNQFAPGGVDLGGLTAAQHNAARMPGARYTKSFNTLTSAFQAEVAGRSGADRVVQWLCGDDTEAKRTVAGLIDEAGFVSVDVGGTAEAAVMEAPRRAGAVYGEEYRADDVRGVLEALRAGRRIPGPSQRP